MSDSYPLDQTADELRSFPDKKFSRAIGLGVRGLPSVGQTRWYTLSVSEGDLESIRIMDSASDLDNDCGDICVSATLETWNQILGEGVQGLRTAITASAIDIKGDLRLFARYATSVLHPIVLGSMVVLSG